MDLGGRRKVRGDWGGPEMVRMNGDMNRTSEMEAKSAQDPAA